MQTVNIDIDLVQYLTEITEVVEILDEGVKLLTTKNGIVMRETIGKWGQVLCEENGIIWVEDAKEDFVVHTYDNTKEDFVVVDVNLPEGVKEALETFPTEELNTMYDDAMNKAMGTVEVSVSKKRGRKSNKG